MGRHKLYYEDPKEVRDSLNEAIESAEKILSNEKGSFKNWSLLIREDFTFAVDLRR